MLFLHETIFQGSLVLERDLAGIVRFLVCISWANDDIDEKNEEDQDGVQTRMGIKIN